MGGPLLLRAFAREGEARAAGLLADFLGELEERVEPPTAIAGTTSRPSSSAGKRATRGEARPRLLDQLTHKRRMTTGAESHVEPSQYQARERQAWRREARSGELLADCAP